MPSFRPLPPSLRPVGRAKAIAPDTRPNTTPVSQAMVDCGVYVDGVRLPGTYSPADALAKVRDVEQTGQEAYVWIGLHEPDGHQKHDVADVYGLHR